jgi:hypothetical protein
VRNAGISPGDRLAQGRLKPALCRFVNGLHPY